MLIALIWYPYLMACILFVCSYSFGSIKYICHCDLFSIIWPLDSILHNHPNYDQIGWGLFFFCPVPSIELQWNAIWELIWCHSRVLTVTTHSWLTYVQFESISTEVYQILRVKEAKKFETNSIGFCDVYWDEAVRLRYNEYKWLLHLMISLLA